MKDAVNSYYIAGYHSHGAIDPTTQALWENLYADVQFFSCHGNVNLIRFANSGIRVGNSSGIYIGTNSVHWDFDTILVTYSSCNSGGINNNVDSNSIVAATANRGANVTVGWRTPINPYSATSWNKRYNEKLSQGWGVLDAANYANRFIYFNSNVKNSTIWNHGDANIRIGKYRNINSVTDEKNILNPNLRNLILDNDLKNIFNEIIKIDSNFNYENYEIVKSKGITTVNVVNNIESECAKYIDLYFKIGDFYTNAGYTIKLKDGIVEAIYDNNININKQQQLLKSRIYFNCKLEDNMINKYKEKSIFDLKEKYKDSNIKINNQTHKYYYDIENEKKYIVITTLNELSYENGAVFEDSFFYEI